MSKRILIADDHTAIRSGVRNILSAAFSDISFDEARDTAETLSKIELLDWDVIILDIDMPGRGGLDVLKYLKDENKKVPVLVFSFHREQQVAVRTIKAGASGYLSKDASDEELVTAIQHLLSGRKYISQMVSEQLVSHLQKPTALPHELLSGREYQTLLLIARGKTVSQIAEELNLSASTIHTYRTRLIEKLGEKNNAGLTSYAYRFNLI